MSFEDKYNAWKKKKDEEQSNSSGFDERYTEWMFRTRGDEVVNGLTTRVNNWLTASNGYITSHNDRYKGGNSAYRSDANDWYTNISNKHSNSVAEADAIRAELDRYSKYLNKDWMDSIYSAIDQNLSSGWEIAESAKKDLDFMSQFKDEYDYNQRYGYPTKYQGMTYDEIQKELDTFRSDIDTLFWTDPRFSERMWLEKYDESYGYMDDSYYDSMLKDIDSQIATVDDEEKKELEAKKKRLLWKREGYEKSAVGDPNSKYYDPNFEEYVAIGQKHYEDTRYDSEEAAANIPSYNFDQKGVAPPKEYTEWKEKLYSFEYLNMDDDERKIYHYWLGKAKEEAGGGEIDESTAERYVDLITEAINTRRGIKMAESINEEGKLAQLFFASYAGLESFGTGIENFFSSEDEYIPATATAVASADVSKAMHEDNSLWGVAYDAINTGANMAPSVALSFVPFAGTALSLGSMGASSAGHAYADAINQGYSVKDARLYSTAVGVTEVGLSYLLDGVIKGGGKLSKAALGKLTSKMTKASTRAIFNFAGKMGSEFIEEDLQEGLFEPVWSNIFLKTDKDVDLLSEEALYAGFLGALSAGGHNAVGSAVNALENRQMYKDAKETYAPDAESLQGLVDSGLENSISKELAEKMQARIDGGKKVSGKDIYNLVQANEKAIRSEDIDTMKNAAISRLQSLGESGDVSVVADIIAKKVSGEALTKSEQAVLESSKYGIRVSNEMSPENVGTGEYSNAWAESIGTERINKDAYNYAENQALRKLAEEAAGVSAPIAEESTTDGDDLLKEAKAMPAVKIHSADDFGTSSDGKTRISSTNTEVAIKGIKAVESKDKNGNTVKQYKFKVVDNDGNESFVDTSDIDYSSTSEGLLYESFVELGIDPAYFDSYVSNFNSNDFKYKFGDVAAEIQYAYGFNEAVNFGKAGLDGGYKILAEDGKSTVSSTYLENGVFTKGLKESVRNLAYNLGKTATENKLEAEAKAIDEAVLKRKESGKGKVKEKGRFHFEQKANEVLNKQQRAGLLVAKRLTSLGNDVYIFRSTVDENGNRVDDRGELCPNGKYYGKDGSIHLDLYAGEDGSGLIAYTAAHELLHNGRRYAQRELKIFKKLLYEWYGEQYDPKHHSSIDQLIKQRMEDEDISWDVAEEEVLADFCEPFLTDGNIEERVAQLKAADDKTFNFVQKIIQKIWNLVKSIYSKISPDSTEGQFSREHKDSLERVYEAFSKMTYVASENLQWTGGMTLVTAEVSVSEDGVIQMQQRHYNEKNRITGKSGRDSLLDYLENRYGKDDANSLISTIDSINAVMDEIKADHPELQIFSQWQDTEIEIDEDGKPIFTTSIKNGDYELNQDFSRVCKKRRQLDFVLNLLAEDPNFKAEYLTKKDFVEINNAIKKHGFEIACALCFVDSKRFRQAEWADSFANTWNDILESVMVKGSKPTPFNFATNKANVADEGIQIDLTNPISVRKWSDGKVNETRHYDNLEHLLSKAMKNGKEAYVEGNSNIRTIATLIRDNPSLRHTFRGADIISSTGFDAIQRLAPGVRNILDGWGGSSVPKPSSMDASYDNSILNIKGYNKEAAFAMGGVRMNSFSDFMAHMFFDYCEAFADLSAKGLPMQSYTKELTFARLFGKSGGKINMSGIAAIRENTLPMKENKKAGITKAQAEKNVKIEKMLAGLDVSRLTEHLQKDVSELTESDLEEFLDMCDYLWADESINMTQATLLQSGILYDKLSDTKQAECYELLKQGKFNEAFKVAGKENVDKEYAKHIGTIVVGVSDAHIRKLLRDPTIRMVIPYHKSSLNPQIAQLLKISVYNDYTDVQSTGVLVKGAPKRVNLSSTAIQDSLGLVDFSFYDYFGKTIDGVTYDGRETANKYLEWCEKGVYYDKVGDYVYYTKKGDGYILAKKLHERYTIVPKFDAFKGEVNYYKVLEDFDCYDTITGEHSPQGAVQFLQNGLPTDYKDVLVTALKEEQSVQDQFRDHLDNQGLKDEIMGIVKKNGYRATEGIGIGRKVSDDTKKSTRKDSRGKQLSDGQQEFFKYSKVVDANGNLKVMYHGTPNGEFNTFRISEGSHSPLMSQYGAGYYFDENRDSAKRYTENVNKSGGKRSPKVFEVYLNITNPLEITDSSHVVTKKQLFDVISRGNDEWFFTDWMPFSLKNWLGKSKSEIQQMPRQDIMNSWVDMTFERAYYDSDILSEMVRAFRGDSILTAMKEVFGKDGVKVTDKYGEMWVAWDSNQIKETSNLKPTESDDIRYSKRKKQDVSNKGLSYASLVSLPDLTGTVLNKNQQVKMTSIGKIDDAWLRKQVIDQCDSVDMPGTLPAHFLYSDAIGKNVEITKDAILHGHQKSIGKNSRNPVPRELLNARALLDLRNLLKNAFVVNLSTKHTNKYSPYAYVMMSVMGMEDANGNVDYYAVRMLVQERFQNNATLLEAEVLGRLSAVNAKKIDLPHPRNVSNKNTSLKHSGQFGYSVADLFGDVKNIFPDTFTNDVYTNLGMKRKPGKKLADYLVYQTRKSGTSARSMLANALESVAQNDIERNKLNQYKEKIDLLNAEEKKLQELNEELRKLSFPEKGAKRDQKRINDLRFEANHTVSRINTLDKMLFDLEASAPLKRVLQREKDAVKKKYEQQGKAMAREKVKEKAESISKKLAKKDLEKLVLDTARWLRNPKKDEVKCPDILRVPFAEFLDSIDMSSKRLLRGGEATQNDLRIAATMDSLATSIEKIRNAQDPSTEASNNGLDAGYLDLPTNFVENIRLMSESIKRLMGMSDTGYDILQEMSSEEMKTLIHVIKTLKKAIRDMQRLYTNYRFANAVTLGQNTMTFVDELGEFNGKIPGLKDFYVWQNTVPYYAFKRFGEAGESIFESFMDAQDKQAFLSKEILDFAESTWTTKEVKKWSEDVHTITLPSGAILTLTTADAMNLYCLARRQHAGGHLVGYGVRVMGIKKGAKKLSDSIAVFTEEDVAEIIESNGKALKLTDRQVEVAEAMQKFMSTTCSEWGNEISMKRFLTRMFTETNYVPIESDSEGLDTKDPEAKKSDLFRLLNISATKPLTENANNRIIVRNLFDVFTEHSNDMARLNAWGMALLDYMKWMNYREKYQTPDGKNKQVGVRQSIRTAYGDAATGYLLNFIKDVNGVGDGGRKVGWVEKMFSRGKTSSVGGNLRVAALQLTAYPRAALVLSPKSLAKGAIKLKPSIAKAKKYCGIALWKSFGYYDTDVSRSMEAQIKGDTSVMDRAKNASMWLAGKADEITWGYLWNACEAEVAATGKYKVGTEEFNIAVGKKLREVVYSSQVVDSVLTRSQLMRSKNSFAKMASSFMSEPTMTHNVTLDCMMEYAIEKRKTGSKAKAMSKTWKHTARATSTLMSTTLLVALVGGLANAFRDDDDEPFDEKFKEEFIGGLLEELIPLSRLPVASDIVGLVAAKAGIGYFSSSDMTTDYLNTISNAYDAWVDIFNNGEDAKKTVYYALFNTVKSLSQFTGVPASNAMRDVVAMWNSTVGDADYTMKIRTYEPSDSANAENLYQAIVSGDTTWHGKLEALWIDETDRQKDLKKVIGDHYAAGDIDIDTAEAYLEEYCGMSDFEADKQADKWEYKAENGTTTGYSEYNDFYVAVETGKNLKAVIQEYTSNGVEKKTLASQITSHFKPMYKEMSNYERASLKGYLLNAYSVLGYERSKKSKDIDKWLKDED